MPKLKLTSAEVEFFAEMRLTDDASSSDGWVNFDPDFRQKDLARLFRRGWVERRTDDGYRKYRITPAGREALATHQEDENDER